MAQSHGGMKVTERQKLNVFEMKCLRSMTGVSRLDRVRNEVVRATAGVSRKLAARVLSAASIFTHLSFGLHKFYLVTLNLIPHPPSPTSLSFHIP